MPNWCSNSVRLTASIDKIDALVEVLSTDDQNIFEHLRPNPAGEWDYGWSVENWGTKWEAGIHDWQREGDDLVTIVFDTAWSPPIALYEYLYENGWEVEAVYEECGMAFCGTWINGVDDYYEYSLDDWESIDCLPESVKDFAGLVDQYNDRQADLEAEREQEEHDAKCTEWFDGKVKPVHVGRYEAKDPKMPNWPFREYADWNGKHWVNGDGKKIKVHSWRGLKEQSE